MNVEILSHNIDTFVAEIRFTHNGVVVHETYNLLLVEPTMKKSLEMTGSTFTREMQEAVINTLAGWIQRNIERGGLTNQAMPVAQP